MEDCNNNTKQPPHSIAVSLVPAARIAVIGTGNFGTALVTRLRQAGAEVVWGSRSPDHSLGQTPLDKALTEGVVVLAVPVFSWPLLPLDTLQPATVIIDPSNRAAKCPPDTQSQAEELQQLVPPGVAVVKCLNTVSAHELENTADTAAAKMVPLCGDSAAAKAAAGEVLAVLGYQARDLGGLARARHLESLPLALFPGWAAPLAISSALWLLLFLLYFARGHLCGEDNRLGWHGRGWENVFSKYINKTCDNHALVLLAACYLPSVLAAYLQLARGTKYSQFPRWLDSWLRMRKQLGLLMLLSASIHGCFYCLLYSPHSTRVTIPAPDTANHTWNWDNMVTVSGGQVPMDWRASLYLGAGVMAYFVAVILGITSLPSVSASLSWREFRLLQSRLGWACLVLATTHCLVNGWKKLLHFNDCIFPGSEQTPLLLPALTLVLKLPLLLPCVDSRLTRIREGRVYTSHTST